MCTCVVHGGGALKSQWFIHMYNSPAKTAVILEMRFSGTLYMCMYSLQIVVPMTGVSFVYNTHVGQHILFMDCGIRLLMHHTIFEVLIAT